MSAELTTLRVEEVNDSLSKGSANLSKEEVDRAIDALIKKMTPAYLELIARNSDTTKRREKTLKENDVFDKDRLIVYPHIESKIKKEQKLENENYLISLHIKIKDLQNLDAFDHLLMKLRNRLFDLGYTNKPNSEVFYVVLEKGILETEHTNSTSYWHRDGGFRTSITTCFSSIENWSTQVLDESKIPNETKDVINNSLTSNKRAFLHESSEIIQSILKQFQTPAKHGFLYDALNVFHRAPRRSDLDGVGENDYRFFIRFEQHPFIA